MSWKSLTMLEYSAVNMVKLVLHESSFFCCCCSFSLLSNKLTWIFQIIDINSFVCSSYWCATLHAFINASPRVMLQKWIFLRLLRYLVHWHASGTLIRVSFCHSFLFIFIFLSISICGASLTTSWHVGLFAWKFLITSSMIGLISLIEERQSNEQCYTYIFTYSVQFSIRLYAHKCMCSFLQFSCILNVPHSSVIRKLTKRSTDGK